MASVGLNAIASIMLPTRWVVPLADATPADYLLRLNCLMESFDVDQKVSGWGWLTSDRANEYGCLHFFAFAATAATCLFSKMVMRYCS